jgi:hypothetical protein
MRDEIIPFLPASKSSSIDRSSSAWVYYPKRFLQHQGAGSEQYRDSFAEQPHIPKHPSTREKSNDEELKENPDVTFDAGHALFQELFFFCRVKNVGDISGTENIYVETVVDRDSGVAFAKLYSARSAMNGLDILESRVIPFFERHGIAIKEIHTRRTNEYCGFPPRHPFETFLAASHIEHLLMDHSSQPYNLLCEQFYHFLLKEFFPPALRKHFQLSLDEMQKDLDSFVDAYNAMQMKRNGNLRAATSQP